MLPVTVSVGESRSAPLIFRLPPTAKPWPVASVLTADRNSVVCPPKVIPDVPFTVSRLKLPVTVNVALLTNEPVTSRLPPTVKVCPVDRVLGADRNSVVSPPKVIPPLPKADSRLMLPVTVSVGESRSAPLIFRLPPTAKPWPVASVLTADRNSVVSPPKVIPDVPFTVSRLKLPVTVNVALFTNEPVTSRLPPTVKVCPVDRVLGADRNNVVSPPKVIPPLPKADSRLMLPVTVSVGESRSAPLTFRLPPTAKPWPVASVLTADRNSVRVSAKGDARYSIHCLQADASRYR